MSTKFLENGFYITNKSVLIQSRSWAPTIRTAFRPRHSTSLLLEEIRCSFDYEGEMNLILIGYEEYCRLSVSGL